ncbi:melatonin receptor type 1A [Aphelenchoides avenae]|nr:melatonin receptor type 1A [Aphelenchus avenae]
MNVDSSLLTADSLARAAVIVAVELLLIFSSCVSICILLRISMRDPSGAVIGSYLISLATADLLAAILVVPLSIYSALSPTWKFDGDGSWVCKSSVYAQIVLLSCTVYTFAWIGVDRYAAFMKPSRYEYEHTLTRCKCWIAFSWFTALLVSIPIMIAQMEVGSITTPTYEMCVLNLTTTIAYSITLGVLVLGVSIATVIFTVFSIFSTLRKPEELEDTQKSILDTDPNFTVTLFVAIAFVLAWTPIVTMQFLNSFFHPSDAATMKFAFVWLAIGGSSSKILVYLFTNPEFRRSFTAVCTGDWGSTLSIDEYPVQDSGGFISSICCCKGSGQNTRVQVNRLPEYGSFAQLPAGF